MKKKIITLVAVILMAMAPSILIFAQPNPGQNSGSTPVGGGPIGGNAPIGGGLAIMLFLGAAYAGKKAYDAQSEN
ncbi:MAG: hypothetical protein CVT94_14060 [Bacteroidetes bacterium HGW-Bacteroidetes-11]|jgi:hypothetical protein|nr:MAG: hypothetical protein CVT94_14060 [Bacteroidetes bacterium HGW-Bacteroidetes-11]